MFQSGAVTGLVDIHEILTPRYAGSKYERNLPAPILDREFPPSSRVGAAEANLGCSSSTIKILDIQSACAGTKGHCVHSGAVVQGNQWETKQLQLCPFCGTPTLVRFTVRPGRLSRWQTRVDSLPCLSSRGQVHPQAGDARIHTLIYTSEQREQRPSCTSRGLGAQKVSVHAYAPRSQVLLRFAKLPRETQPESMRDQPRKRVRESARSVVMKNYRVEIWEGKTETATSARESREPSVCCS